MMLKWNDPRFKFNTTSLNESLVFERDMAKHIWLPDIFILNEVTGKEGYKAIQKVHISPHGDVQFARR